MAAIVATARVIGPLLTVLLAHQALHAQCPPICPRGAILENEACGDEINKGCEAPGPEGSNCCVPNGGWDCDDIGCFNAVCEAEPWCCKLVWDQMCADLAQELCPALCNGDVVQAWIPITIGDTVCGTTWADGFDSDADWYALKLDAISEITISLDAGVELAFAIADLDGGAACDPTTELDPSTIVAACSSSSLTACLEPGVHYIRVRPTAITGIPCGSPQATYVLRVTGSGRRCTLPDPVNDTCERALPITEGTTPLSTLDAATESLVGDVTCSGKPFRRDVWFSYTASRDGVLRIATCGTASYPAMIGIYHGTCADAELIACDHQGSLCLFGDPQLDVDVTQGESYLIRVGSDVDKDGVIALTLSYTACEGPYTVEVIGPPPHQSVATAISNAGEIMGTFAQFEPFRWSETSGAQELPGLAAEFFGLNDQGIAVGWIASGTQKTPVSAVGLAMIPLPNTLPLCSLGVAYAINESGQIVGGLFGSNCGSPTPVTWVDGVISALPVPSATGAARDINNAGAICGDGPITGAIGVGWTLIDGVFGWLPVPIPGATVLPAAINDANLVAGEIFLSGSFRTAFLWDGTSMTQLPPPAPYLHSVIVDLNNAGTAIGEFRESSTSTANGGAFLLRQGGVPRMLNVLLAAHSTFGISDVRAINDGGVIVGANSPSLSSSKAVRLVPSTPSGDTNCDGEVDAVDLAAVLGAWGECSMNDTCLADFTLDGRVDGADLAVVLGGWGPVRR